MMSKWLRMPAVGSVTALLVWLTLSFMTREMIVAQKTAPNVSPPLDVKWIKPAVGSPAPPGAQARGPGQQKALQPREDKAALVARGMEYFRTSRKTLDDLLPVTGESESIADYLSFCKESHTRFFLWDTELGRYLGEVHLDGVPRMEPKPHDEVARLAKKYSGKGREVRNPDLVGLAKTAAADQAAGEIKLYAIVGPRYAAYLAAKINETVTQLQAKGVELRDILGFRAQLCLEDDGPAAVFKAAVLKTGEMPLNNGGKS